MPNPFAVKDCALLAIATGRRAHNLRELAFHVEEVHPGSIYHHFWGNRLRPGLDVPEFQNDFATWSRFSLHDFPLSERLGIINPKAFDDLEELRREVLDVIEERLSEVEFVPWARRDQQFVFIRSQLVVFDTLLRVKEPRELGPIVPCLTVSSIFYHFIDAQRRLPERVDDFSAWLAGFGDEYEPLRRRLADVDPYFSTLTELRERLAAVFAEMLGE